MKQLMLALCVLVLTLPVTAETITIGISQIVDHPALNAVRQGVVDRLADAGYVEGENLQVLVGNAQGDTSVAISIAQNFRDRGADLVVAIATPTAIAAVQVFGGSDVPVVYSAVTAPAEYGLTEYENVTGVSDLIDPPLDLALLKELDPRVQRVGMVYNPGEANSAYLTELAKEEAPALGLEIVTAAADSSAMVLQAAQSLVGRVDAIYVTTDNTVVSALESVVQVANAEEIPFLMADPESRARGPLVCAGWDYYNHGLLTGERVLEILGGKTPEQVPHVYQKDTEFGERQIWLNLDTAGVLGIEFPEAVLEQANGIILGGSEFVPRDR
ncbi:MAG: ABC transporter substrate-binding protein [Candidatus Bipolaricaulota bacterium]